MSDDPAPQIATEKARFVIGMARQFDMKVAMSDPQSGSNANDDGMVDILEDDSDDVVEQQLVNFNRDLNMDEKIDLVALPGSDKATDTSVIG